MQVQIVEFHLIESHLIEFHLVLFRDNNRVFTFSMHCKENYFSEKQVSDLDVEVDAGSTDAEYLKVLSKWLEHLGETVVSPAEAGSCLVFFQAGIDILNSDRLGKLGITRTGAQERNKIVYKFMKTYNCLGPVITMVLLSFGSFIFFLVLSLIGFLYFYLNRVEAIQKI